MISSWTVELAHNSTPPMGAKMTPTAKKSGSTVLGVKMGCQAFSRCWRKALSVLLHQPKHIPRSPVFCSSASHSVVSCSSAGPSCPPLRSACCAHPAALPSFANSTFSFRRSWLRRSEHRWKWKDANARLHRGRLQLRDRVFGGMTVDLLQIVLFTFA